MRRCGSVLTPLPAPLLFWQVGLLSVVAGIVAWVHPLAGGISWLVGIVADSRVRGLARLAFLGLCFVLGFAAAGASLSTSLRSDGMARQKNAGARGGGFRQRVAGQSPAAGAGAGASACRGRASCGADGAHLAEPGATGLAGAEP